MIELVRNLPMPSLFAAGSTGATEAEDLIASLVLPLLAGAASIFLLLPRPRPRPWLPGAALGLLALVLAGVFLVPVGAATPETVLFYAFSGLAVAAGAMLVTQRNPARAAIAFALVVLSTCGLFLLRAAPFLMAATVIIYAGAIVVTFLFVIMLAQQEGFSSADRRSREPFLATVAGFVLLGALLCVLQRTYKDPTLDDLLGRVDWALAADDPAEARRRLGNRGPTSASIPRANAVSVDIAVPHPPWPGPPALKAR